MTMVSPFVTALQTLVFESVGTLIDTSMQKTRMGHRAKFRDKSKCFLRILFPVCAILRGILTSGILRARLVIEIWIHSVDACIPAMSCVSYVRAWLKTLSSLLQ